MNSFIHINAWTSIGVTGVATSIGEQPIKGLVSPSAQARMTVGECVTNLMWAPITKLEVGLLTTTTLHLMADSHALMCTVCIGCEDVL